MKRRMRRIGTAGLTLLGASVALAGLLATGAPTNKAWAEDKEVNVYNWADYIGTHTIEKFEQATGIKVRYDLFDSNEVVEAKMLAGGVRL